MNLIKGKLVEKAAPEEMLPMLRAEINKTLMGEALDPYQVAEACGKLAEEIGGLLSGERAEEVFGGSLESILKEQFLPPQMVIGYLERAKEAFGEEALTKRLETELYGESDRFARSRTMQGREIYESVMPLGVLFHVAAGNMDVLPAYSVLEGLLAGNINILKMPSQGSELSIHLLAALIERMPRLKDYIYVFDYTSKDGEMLAQLAELSDAVVIWGGDEAIKAFRQNVKPDTRIIEWGHKISFAYVTEQGIRENGNRGLMGIAENICLTNQLLCSSCQGILFDTEETGRLHAFCKEFLPILEEADKKTKAPQNIPLQAQVSLRLQSARLQGVFDKSEVFQGDGVSVIAYPDSRLDASIQFRNCWARAVPVQKLFEVIRPYKNYLQTAALVCGEEERAGLESMLFRAGVVRISDGRYMSEDYPGMPHDGEFSLRRYTKIVTREKTRE